LNRGVLVAVVVIVVVAAVAGWLAYYRASTPQSQGPRKYLTSLR